MIKRCFYLFMLSLAIVVSAPVRGSSLLANDSLLPDVRIIAQGSMQGLTFPAG
jgi:hypothetical protein